MRGEEFGQGDRFEGGDADDLKDLMEVVGQLVFLFGDGDQEVGADGRPDLGADRIGRAPQKVAQPQVLLDPAEKQFDLPAATVEQAERLRGQIKAVGEEDDREPVFFVVGLDPAQRRFEAPPGPLGLQLHGLVRPQPQGAVHRTFGGDLATDMDLGADDKKAPACTRAVSRAKSR